MGMMIHYPANVAEWYAKGNADPDIYFEVPAVFNADGTCDTAATEAKVENFLTMLRARQNG